jgi:hypothetical protein
MGLARVGKKILEINPGLAELFKRKKIKTNAHKTIFLFNGKEQQQTHLQHHHPTALILR